MESHYFEVIISGGGMVGMSLAVALAREGVQVALVERGTLSEQTVPEFDGRVSAIALGSKIFLEHIGVWPHIAAEAQPITDIRVSDRDSHAFLHYDHREVADRTAASPFGYIVENRHTRIAFHEAARDLPTLHLFERARIRTHETNEGSARITLEDERMLSASLLVVAEGKQSGLREALGIASNEVHYAQTAIVCTIEHTLPHHGLAQERFLAAGPFAVLPLTGNRSSLVWVEPRERAPLYVALDKTELAQEIQERVGDYLGEVTPVGPVFSYPLSLIHVNTFTAPRAVVVGDAAHGMHPIAGQGVNVGFRDVAALSELILAHRALGQDLGSPALLSEYTRARRFDTLSMLAITDGLNRLFLTDWLPLRLARRAGLSLVEKIRPAKRYFMLHAMGMFSDAPREIRK